ncbi:MAG: sugar phosphate isomerase/epimerase [Clostridia bacterium]|nr:sugar phosphate isomerase/epimerase [Clostridia bacterium]
MHLCVTSGICSKLQDGTPLPFQASVDMAVEAGFEEFDMGLNSKLMLREDWQTEIALREEAMSKAGIRVRYVHIPFDYPRDGTDEDWERFTLASMRAIDQAAAWGADCAAIHPRCFMTAEYDADSEYADAVAFLRPYCEHASKRGLQLGIEIMRGAGASAPARIRRFATDTDVLIRLADEMGTGICWDTGHANISLQDQGKCIRKVGKRLKMVHINDNFAEDDVHLAPFLGRIGWDEVVKALREIGYAGSMNLEVNSNRLPESLRRPYTAYMAASGRLLIEMFEKA